MGISSSVKGTNFAFRCFTAIAGINYLDSSKVVMAAGCHGCADVAATPYAPATSRGRCPSGTFLMAISIAQALAFSSSENRPASKLTARFSLYLAINCARAGLGAGPGIG